MGCLASRKNWKSPLSVIMIESDAQYSPNSASIYHTKTTDGYILDMSGDCSSVYMVESTLRDLYHLIAELIGDE